MLKSEKVNNAALRKMPQRAVYSTTLNDHGWVHVRDGLPCWVGLYIDVPRQFIRFYHRFELAHLDEAEIKCQATRLNGAFHLVKLTPQSDSIDFGYELPFGEGLSAVTLIRIMRRFANICAEATSTLPKPLADRRTAPEPQQKRLH